MLHAPGRGWKSELSWMIVGPDKGIARGDFAPAQTLPNVSNVPAPSHQVSTLKWPTALHFWSLR